MSYDIAIEAVPSFVKRIGDRVIEGSNNSLIVLGTDRPSDLDSGHGHIGVNSDGKDAGSIHIVVGRLAEDFDMVNDRAFMQLSMKTDPDKNLDILSVGRPSTRVAAAITKADVVRIVARADVKITSANGKSFIILKSDGTIVVDGEIKLGKNATERIILGDAFQKLWMKHTHPTPAGTSGPPNHPLTDAHLSKRKVLVE